jgi:hypothetical protein
MKNQELKYNVYFEIEPLYYVSRLLGLAQFSFSRKKSGETEVHYLHSDIILTTTLSVLLLVGLCLAEFFLTKIPVLNIPILIRSLWFISFLSTYSTCIITLIFYVTIHRKHFPLLLRRIYIIDSKLFNDGRNEKRYKSRRSGITKQMAVIAIMWIINFLPCIYNFFHAGILYTLSLVLRILCNTTFLLISYQYTSMVLVLRARYKHLVSIFSDLLITKGNLYDRDLTYISNSGPSGACISLHDNTRYFDVSQILEMRRIYCQLHDVLWLINKYYRIPVLLVIISTMVNFIPNFFTAITLIQNVILGQQEFVHCLIMNFTYVCLGNFVLSLGYRGGT